MTASTASFSNLSFTIGKPGWGESSLVLEQTDDDTYSLRVKHVEHGVSTIDDVQDYPADAAASLDGWIRVLGFCDNPSIHEPVPFAGSWTLRITDDHGNTIAQGGTDYPGAFPDLLSTMIGLGLPGFQGTSTQAFLADFRTPQQPRNHASSAPDAHAGSDLPIGSSEIAELRDALNEITKDPQKAEAMLREQSQQLPLSMRQQMLEYVKRTDPDRYEWWRRILLG